MSTRFFRKLFMRRHTQHSARARWVVPTLEPLEHRNLLAATYLWTGDGNGNWSDPADWQNKATGKPATVAPGSTDSVTFDGTHLVNCNVDPAATTTVHDLTVDVTYIKRIDFRRNLAVAGGVASIGGGEIYLNNFTLAVGFAANLPWGIPIGFTVPATLKWTGGRIDMIDGQFILSEKSSGTIANNGDKTAL